MYFQNLHNPEIQKKIKQLCQGKSGVYKIINLANQKSYIGSAITKKATANRLYIGFRNHFFNHHKELALKRAIKKHGAYGFSWEILEFTEISNTRIRETWYIQKLLSEYNILQSAESSLGYCHTAETREKMKAIYSDSRRQVIGVRNKGKNYFLKFVKNCHKRFLTGQLSKNNDIRKFVRNSIKKCFQNPHKFYTQTLFKF